MSKLTVQSLIESLTKDSQFIGFLGRGFENSFFYKLYVKPTENGKWIHIEYDLGITNSDPIEDQQYIRPEKRVKTIVGNVLELAVNDYECHMPEKKALAEFMAAMKAAIN